MTIAARPLEDEPSEVAAPAASRAAEEIAEQIRVFAADEYRQVVATVALWSGSTGDAADAVADALARAWERLDKGRSIDNLAAFVTTVAMNRVRSAQRRRALFRRKRHLLGVVDTHEPADAATRRVDVARAVRGLSRRQQEVVALRYGADLSIDAIADRLGIAPGTVKATLHQARAALSDRLGTSTRREAP